MTLIVIGLGHYFPVINSNLSRCNFVKFIVLDIIDGQMAYHQRPMARIFNRVIIKQQSIKKLGRVTSLYNLKL